MKLLAIDTSAAACSVALLIDNEVNTLHEIIPMQQAQQILPMIDKLLSDHDVTLKDLSALAFGCGPGSFTGVRIATSVIQGLAYATGLPVISVSSLAAAAQAAFEQYHWPKILVAMDARMNEIYAGAYQVNAQGLMELHGQESVCPPQLLPKPDGTDWYGAGNGWEAYQAQLLVQPIAVAATSQSSAFGVILLAKDKYLNQEFLNPEEAMPVYLRDNVAEKGK
jgi:tRNA threonylcarbamoyladenosine biosynthesis protein TsaB